MVTKLANPYHPSVAPRDFTGLVRASFSLWLSSLGALWWPALGYSLVSQLPWLPWWWNTRAQFEHGSWRAWIEPGLFRPDAVTTLVSVIAALVGLLFFLVLLERQGRIARGLPPEAGEGNAMRVLPTALAATLAYLMLNAIALAPVIVAWAWGSASGDAMVLLLALLAGLVLSAAPLAWVSVAAGFFYPAILLDGAGAWASLRGSLRRVRGRWVPSASLVSLMILICFGLLGTVGVLPFLITGAVAFGFDGIDALLRPGWLVWGQVLCAPLMALGLPLATAGYLVCYEDLGLRQPGRGGQ